MGQQLCTSFFGSESGELNDKVARKHLSRQLSWERATFEMNTSLEECGQTILAKHLSSLGKEDRKKLETDLKQFDFEEVQELFERSKKERNKAKAEITPFTDVYFVNKLEAAEREKLLKLGLQMLGEGKCAMILLAGGQGTRLGFNQPKGCYRVGLPSKKSLFDIQADRLMRMREIVAEACDKEVEAVHIPWYIMTSLATDKDTKDFFQENTYFGLPEEDIFFFCQAYLPSLTEDGQVILETPTKCAKNPNGNGGIYSALETSGALQDMIDNGVEYVQTYSVDNILIRMADPMWFAHMQEKSLDCSNKVCRKREPHEKVGVMCRRDGKPSVIEYSEISKEMAEMINDENKLVYGCGNVAMHGFSVKFLESVLDQALPIHVAKKQIVSYQSTSKDGKVSGIKLELFIFDTFAHAEKMSAYEALREEEFSPVKNSNDKPKDTPNTAKKHFSNMCRKYAIDAGIKLADTEVCEIDARKWYVGVESKPKNFVINSKI